MGQSSVALEEIKNTFQKRLISLQYQQVNLQNMQIQRKAQKFKNQIRRRQRAEILSNLRSQFYDNLQEQDTNDKFNELKNYFTSPTSEIPVQILKHLHTKFTQLKTMEQIINQKLDCNNVVNVVFVTEYIQIYNQIQTTNFFNKCIANLNNKDQQINKLQIKLDSFTNFKCIEQIYLYFCVIYLKNIPQEQKVTQNSIVQIINYFLDYWNANIDNQNVDYKLCAILIFKLYQCKETLQNYKSQMQGIISVILSENRSLQTYQLIKSLAIACGQQFQFFLILQPKFPSFIYEGIHNQQTCLNALTILGTILQVQSFDKQVSFDYLKILKQMEKQFHQTKIMKIKRNILMTFYNFTFYPDYEIQEFFLKLNYEQLYIQSKAINLYEFLDFCLAVVISYQNKFLRQNIMFGKRFKLSQKICEYLQEKNTANNINKVFDLAESLLGCLQIIITLELDQCKINLLILNLQSIVKKLQIEKWNQNCNQKQKLLQNYDNILNELRQKEEKFLISDHTII